jgi:anti-anti-sigma factor
MGGADRSSHYFRKSRKSAFSSRATAADAAVNSGILSDFPAPSWRSQPVPAPGRCALKHVPNTYCDSASVSGTLLATGSNGYYFFEAARAKKCFRQCVAEGREALAACRLALERCRHHGCKAADGGMEDKEMVIEMEKIFTIERTGEAVVVVPQDDLRELAFQQIETEANEILEALEVASSKKVVLDFHKTDYFGSAALGFFMKLWLWLRRHNGQMALCNLSAHETEVLQITKLDRLWSIFASRKDAQEALRG